MAALSCTLFAGPNFTGNNHTYHANQQNIAAVFPNGVGSLRVNGGGAVIVSIHPLGGDGQILQGEINDLRLHFNLNGDDAFPIIQSVELMDPEGSTASESAD